MLRGRASDEFLAAQDAMGMTPDRIPKFSELNEVLREATGWTLMGVEGLLPELDFFDHLANRRFPVTWWIRRPDQVDYLEEPRSEEPTSELQSLMRTSYAVFCLKTKKKN